MERFNFLNAKVTLREFVLVALALFFLSLFISKSRQKQLSLDILMLVNCRDNNMAVWEGTTW